MMNTVVLRSYTASELFCTKRFISTSSILLGPKSNDAKVARDKSKKKELRKLAMNKNIAKDPAYNQPLYMPLDMALRYLRAAEVGYPTSQQTISITTKIVRDKGTPNLRGKVFFPHSIESENSKSKIMVFTNNDQSQIDYYKNELGCDYVGGQDLVDAIQNDKINLDEIKLSFATPDIASSLNKLGKKLGPKGLLPSTKRGTVAENLTNIIKENSASYPFTQKRADAISFPVGRLTFSDLKLAQNINAVRDGLYKSLSEQQSRKPSIVGHTYITSTNSPAITIDFK
ncbi:hypothetical protein ACO0RG_002509 [Hanseniaspora osmophila]|uniref:54S ribosomal protein L1, mitochondrial n=1 Tax=Hanseniaspora osmophila TaxID=56408 RepID=A0A1E5RVB7_9ASCO|nr:54S ribosomal protein L1, mitochondrial [Hanseniaspora osmophila]